MENKTQIPAFMHKWKYHPEKTAKIVTSVEELSALGEGWYDSPAEFGVETCPGIEPCPKIAANKKQEPQKKKSHRAVSE